MPGFLQDYYLSDTALPSISRSLLAYLQDKIVGIEQGRRSFNCKQKITVPRLLQYIPALEETYALPEA